MRCSQSQQSIRGNLERLPLTDLEQFAAEQGIALADDCTRSELVSILTDFCQDDMDNEDEW